ncbi:MAG TPA: glycosyltransferase family 2 protein [Solirubrobacteraceae bacterium]|nr:glycosyltransferase family 2 protein [Solirubrobacteraceae bacterium]
MPDVTVAIPVRDGGALLARTLAALAAQTVPHELLVCDSGSRDGSVALAREHGARVIEIPPARFGHGATRNLLLTEARGERVALLTQDAEPVDERWLERLLAGFALAGDVAIVYGPYRPRPGAPPAVALELEHWFASLAPDGLPTVERLAPEERALPVVELLGRRGFFTDANACIDRAAWERTPFREVPYAEDRVLAIDVLRAGAAKAFVPDAAVWHSHDYTPVQQLRRAFDEWRGLLEVYGWREPADPRRLARQLRGELGRARRELVAAGVPANRATATLAALAGHHLLRSTGALLGSRADRLPPWGRRGLSLERRATFAPLRWD